jgi:molecular chaperone DnaJ
MSSEDFYKLLGVPKGASQDEIKQAFKKKAKEYHPDRNPGKKEVEEKFKAINEAYEVLKDPDKRAAYDRYGKNGFNQTGGAGGFDPRQGFKQSDFRDFSDIFGNIFEDLMGGGANPHFDNTRGSDLRYNLNINLEEAYSGKERTIKYNTATSCDDCHGKGTKSKDGLASCLNCGGSGRSRIQQGFFMVEKTCRACGGTGKVIKNPCNSCGGQGRVEKEKTIKVNIPAGVEEGSKIRIAEGGEAGVMGGKTGDLYIFIHIKKHGLYKREGNDLICQVPIKMTTAALGGSIDIPGIDGNLLKINIPQGTQAGSILRLKSKGMTILRKNSHGDLLVEIKVEIPTRLTDKQKALLESFDLSAGEANHPESEGFFSKVKSFLSGLSK